MSNHFNSNHFNNFYEKALNSSPPDCPFLAIWVHTDGRILGMTGVSYHRISTIPNGYVRDTYPLENGVDIYVHPSMESWSQPRFS
jgi:hypothetical protein